MSRLIVRNSSLVYPPVPDSLVRDDDIILPLVDRFEEAVFMPGPAYDRFRELLPGFSLEVRNMAREIGNALPEWLGAPSYGLGHSVWDAYADHFVNFALGPILVNDFLVGEVARLQPDEVLAWELHARPAWWAGRQMVAETAKAVGEACGCPVELSAPALRRAFRDATLPALRTVQVLRELSRLRSENPRPPEGTVDALFVVPGPTLVPMFDRIGRRLQSEHGMTATALDLPMGGPTSDIPPGALPRHDLHSFSDRSVEADAMLAVVAASNQFREAQQWLRAWGRARDLPRALQDVLERAIHSTLVRELPVALYHSRLWRRAFDALQPRAVVSFNSYNKELSPAVLQARARGIPTVCVQHGIWGPRFRAAALLPHDDILVFGEYAREMLIPLAADHTRFVQTGHCMYDELDMSIEESDLRRDIVEEHRHLVVVTTQPIEARLMMNEQRWWLRGLAEACAAADAMLAIKPHPHEDRSLLDRYAALTAEMPETVRLIRHGEVPLKDLIAASDLLVTRFSTTAFEAALLGKPVMTVNLSGGPDQYPFEEEGCAVGVHEYDDIGSALRALLEHEQHRRDLLAGHDRFLTRHLGPRDGRATERIADCIAERSAQS